MLIQQKEKKWWRLYVKSIFDFGELILLLEAKKIHYAYAFLELINVKFYL